MNDLIRRQDAIISVNELHGGCITEDVKRFIHWQINNVISVDAVEVVRCGECKHMSPVGVCTYFADSEVRPSASDFCSYGERKTDG